MAGRETTLCTMPNDLGGWRRAYWSADKRGGGSHRKLYLHPACSYDYKPVCIYGAPEGRRQVFVVDLGDAGPRSACTSTTIDQAKNFARCYFVFP